MASLLHIDPLDAELPASPLAAEAFAADLPLAVAGAHYAGVELALVVLRANAGQRGLRRLHDVLRDADAFSYELQPGGYALLMPGAGAWEALQAALRVHVEARGGLFVSGALVTAGVATLEPGEDARELFARAAQALAEAGAGGDAARVAARPEFALAG